jgi:hypothetical protein
MQSAIIGNPNAISIAITFDTEKDRVKGFAELFRSNSKFDGKGKTKFVISERQYNMLKEKNINFKKL